MNGQEYKKILAALIEILNEGVHIVDGSGISVFYNETMAKIEQTSVDDILGKDFINSFRDIKLEESTIYQALRSGECTYDRPQQYTSSSGKPISTVNTTVPVLDDQGKRIAAIEVANNITQLTQLSDRVMMLQEQMAPPKTVKAKKLQKYKFSNLIGTNPLFQRSVALAQRAAQNDESVFIYGETGTGKELFAQSIHYDGKRAKGPFLAQNCAALPGNLLEGILFGTMKGGFTGALDRAGLFEQANGGTLLLDELNSMPYDLQSKLLRVLQESYVRRVGGLKDIPIDVRVIATVNEDPQELFERGVLRKDLYYRLSVINIEIPPLRERKSDILKLAESLVAKHSGKFSCDVFRIAKDAIDLLVQYDYPGNVRELENILVQAMFNVDSENTLTADLIALPRTTNRKKQKTTEFQVGEPFADYIEGIERDILEKMFQRYNGNVSQCASALRMKRQTLQHKLKKYEILF